MPRQRLSGFLSDLQRYGVRRFRGVAPGFGPDPVTIELEPGPPPPARLPATPRHAEPRVRATWDDKPLPEGPEDALEAALTRDGEITPADLNGGN